MASSILLFTDPPLYYSSIIHSFIACFCLGVRADAYIHGAGTDHAWGGNYFIVHGGRPSDLTETGDLNIGQGRLLASTPWEGVWNGLAEWFGVSSENMISVLPNKQNFGGVNIVSKADIFD